MPPPQQGLVQHLDHGERPGKGVGAALEQERVAVGILEDLEILAVEGFLEPALHLRSSHDRERHQLEDGAVGGGDLGQRAPAHEQGHVARGDLLARSEAEYSLLHLPDLDAELPQHPAGGGEELPGREGMGELEGDEVALLPQSRRDHKGHAELLAEDLVDEGYEGDVVEAHPDRVAAELRSEAVRDAFRDGALDDDPGGAGGACTGAGRLGGQGRRLALGRGRGR